MRLTFRATENTLVLTRDTTPDVDGTPVEIPGYVDVSEGGRLVGVELLPADDFDLTEALAPWVTDPVAAEYVEVDADGAYITLSVPEEGLDREMILSAPSTLRAELDDAQRLIALAIPRRGAGYEISYPSGNQ